MGKKKQQKETGNNKPEERGKKVYSLSNAKQEGTSSTSRAADELPKISIPQSLEKDLLDLIQRMTSDRKMDKEVSKRLTSKKLMDIYGSLNGAGFSHKQVEQAMENTILHGGDLVDALDWLCLNLPNDRLPANFSQALQKEEDEKWRPNFDVSQQVSRVEHLQQGEITQPSQEKQTEIEKNEDKSKDSTSAQKSWIMQYAAMETDSEEEREDSEQDPNERFLELTALLLDAKAEANEFKKAGNKNKLKEISKKIKEYIVEMDALEKNPTFDPQVKLSCMTTEEKGTKTPQQVPQNQSNDQSQDKSNDKPHDKSDNAAEDDGDLGLSLFTEKAEPDTAPEKAKSPTKKEKEDFRSFEYTRQQWTGKSPKQFLIDWCRKHLPKSPPPKFEKINPRGNKFKCKVTVDRKKEGILQECPSILCGNVKEAEHVAATLALYHLCRGQSVYQLLPPPYRDVWLEWMDAEKQAKQEEKMKENKPRDQFLAKLMSKIQLCDKDKGQQVKVTTDTDDDEVLDSWENFDDEAEDMASESEEKLACKNRTSSRRHLDAAGLKKLYLKHKDGSRYQTLLKTRRDLPVFQHRDVIIEKLQQHNVVLIAGETGSGKSTQVPHFILEKCLVSAGGQNCNIVCTEPRRISAISLATRVSQEMGENKLGGQDSLCGYQIRFESRCGPNTKLTYCTTGVLLRKLQVDPTLGQVSHIIVDEVHERSVQSDFLLIILRKLLMTRKDLKVILMSATLDADKFSSYFSHCPVINIPGRTFPVQVFHVEDIVEQTGYVLDEDSPYCLRQSDLVQEDSTTLAVTEKGGSQAQVDVFWTKEDVATIDRTSLSAEKYSKKTRNIITRLNMRRINMDLIVEVLLYLDTSEEFRRVPGAVLVFLPGLADITELYDTLLSDRRFMDKDRYLVLALHSVLSSTDQAQAFSVPPSGVRKVVLATNIAETGITIPDVVFVIDSGKVKENRYIETSQMNALEEVLISKANAKQRQGRAGRVQDGYCFRLFTKQMYEDMRPYTVPELLRVPLEELCLHIMKCDYGKPEKFLSQALDPPQSQVISRAMALLHSIGACVEGERLTPLGHHLAALPVHVRIGKMLLHAAVFGCLEPVAVIAASMTDKSPFVAPLGKQDLANAAKQSMGVAASDHLTLYNAYLGWKEARGKGRQAEMSFCQKNFIKRNTMLEIENVKEDLIKLVQSIGFTDTSQVQSSVPTEYEKDGVLLITKHQTVKKLDQRTIAKVKAILTAGLYPNVAKLSYEAPVDAAANPEQKICIAETPQGPAAVHPSSVNRTLQANGWLIYHQKVRSARVYLRDCSMVSAYPLLLFGGEITVQHTDQLLSVDERIKYKAYAKTGVIFKELRKLLDDVLAEKLDDPAVDITRNPLVTLIEDLLVSEKIR